MRKLTLPIDLADCEVCNKVVNGYFYILVYNATSDTATKEGYDELPVIYCHAPHVKKLNCFWGINFHLFNEKTSAEILKQMGAGNNLFINDDVRVFFTNEKLYQFYNKIGEGVRCYNRKNVIAAYRIKNSKISKYIEIPPDFVLTDKNKVSSDLALAND